MWHGMKLTWHEIFFLIQRRKDKFPYLHFSCVKRQFFQFAEETRQAKTRDVCAEKLTFCKTSLYHRKEPRIKIQIWPWCTFNETVTQNLT